jgi:hypothetical protein
MALTFLKIYLLIRVMQLERYTEKKLVWSAVVAPCPLRLVDKRGPVGAPKLCAPVFPELCVT